MGINKSHIGSLTPILYPSWSMVKNVMNHQIFRFSYMDSKDRYVQRIVMESTGKHETEYIDIETIKCLFYNLMYTGQLFPK